VVIVGPAADAIVDYAQEHGVDLIVMSTRNRSALQRWLLGSVTDRVLHLSTVPVSLIRAGASLARA
jgi:nucleotide-binding universal stress UspA family protein